MKVAIEITEEEAKKIRECFEHRNDCSGCSDYNEPLVNCSNATNSLYGKVSKALSEKGECPECGGEKVICSGIENPNPYYGDGSDSYKQQGEWKKPCPICRKGSGKA